MTFVDLIALIFAVGAPINAWKHRGGIFDNWREGLSTWGADLRDHSMPPELVPALRVTDKLRMLVGQLIDCRFCLHYHAALWLIMLYGVSLACATPWDVLVKLPIYWLAIVRASHWGVILFDEESRDDEQEG